MRRHILYALAFVALTLGVQPAGAASAAAAAAHEPRARCIVAIANDGTPITDTPSFCAPTRITRAQWDASGASPSSGAVVRVPFTATIVVVDSRPGPQQFAVNLGCEDTCVTAAADRTARIPIDFGVAGRTVGRDYPLSNTPIAVTCTQESYDSVLAGPVAVGGTSTQLTTASSQEPLPTGPAIYVFAVPLDLALQDPANLPDAITVHLRVTLTDQSLCSTVIDPIGVKQ